MIARLRLLAATAAFAGWLAWLGYAVTQRGAVPPVSRGQLTAATHLVVADLTPAADDPAVPADAATVRRVVRGDGLGPGDAAAVLNLRAAKPPTGPFPLPGTYLLPLVGEGNGFRVAGLPPSPGYPEAGPPRPAVYPWTDGVRAQLRQLGIDPGP